MRLPIKNKRLRDAIELAIQTVALVALLFAFCWPYEVEGASMLPGIRDGDRVVISRFDALAGRVKQGDLVVVRNPLGEPKRILKRVAALPGETVPVNGGQSIKLAADEYYLLGDNREESRDSRHFGPVKKGAVIGRVFGRFFPFDAFQAYP